MDATLAQLINYIFALEAEMNRIRQEINSVREENKRLKIDVSLEGDDE